jgi:hypothetical protein
MASGTEVPQEEQRTVTGDAGAGGGGGGDASGGGAGFGGGGGGGGGEARGLPQDEQNFLSSGFWLLQKEQTRIVPLPRPPGKLIICRILTILVQPECGLSLP